MLKTTVNLSTEVTKILECFGTIQEVANKALTALENDEIDLAGIPAYQLGRGRVRQYRIIVDNETYEQQYNTYGAHSNTISLGRLLTYIALDEVYERLGWVPIVKKADPMLDEDVAYSRVRDNLIDALQRYTRVCKKQRRTLPASTKNFIKELNDEK